MKNFLFPLLFTLWSGQVALVWAQPSSSGVLVSQPPLNAQATQQKAAAQYLATEADGKIRLSLQVLAPGAVIEALRLDNIGGQTSLWRSDGGAGEAGRLTVTRQGGIVADGSEKINYGPLGQGEEIFELLLADNGAFKERKTNFRVTVFMAGGTRINTLLTRVESPASTVAAQTQTASTSQNDQVKALEAQIADLQKQNEELKNRPQTEPKEERAPNTSAQEAQPGPPPAPKEYAPGWLVRIISVEKDFKITDPTPLLEVVNFVATKSGYKTDDYTNLADGAFKVPYALWKGEAFLRADEAGKYIFSTTSKINWTGKLNQAILVEGVVVATGSTSPLMGSVELEPGLYRFEYLAYLNVNNADQPDMAYASFNLQVKGPSDEQMRPITDALLIEKTAPTPSTGKKK